MSTITSKENWLRFSPGRKAGMDARLFGNADHSAPLRAGKHRPRLYKGNGVHSTVPVWRPGYVRRALGKTVRPSLRECPSC